MTLDQIDRLIRQANPVPDLESLEQADPSVLDHWRRTEMQTQEPIEIDHEPKSDPWRTWLAIAALAAVIVGALLLMEPGPAPVADAPTTLTEVPAPEADAALETATAFFEAFAAFDADRAAVYLAPEALDEFGGSDAMRLQVAVSEAMRQERMLQGCVELESRATGTDVRCDYTYHALGSDLLGRGPYDGNWFDFTVRAGEIVAVAEHDDFERNGFSDQIWEPFALWLAETYPEDVAVLYTDATQTMQARTEDSRLRWAERIEEWIVLGAPGGASVELSEAFVAAFLDFDADTLATYLAPGADLSSFEWDGGTWPLALRLLEAQGFQAELIDCHPVSRSEARTVVSCPIVFHALRSDEIGQGPFTGSAFSLTVAGGQVTRASLNLVITEFSPTMWEPFALWLLSNHPEDVAVMYTDASQTLEALTEESIALWEQRTREYVAFVNGG